MANNHLIFNFADMSQRDQATRDAKRYFGKAGVKVVQADASVGILRQAGVSYREMRLTFGDGQTVTFRVKQTGDIYQVLVNDRVTPIRDQSDHEKAIEQIAKLLDAGRSAFQKKLAAARVQPPPGIRTAAPKMEAILTEKRDYLRAAIDAAKEKLASFQPATAAA